MSLQGNLKSFSLAEILQSLSLHRHTGTLHVRTKRGEQVLHRYLQIAEGAITFVSPESPKGFRLGEILIRQGKVSKTQVQEALAIQSETGERLGKTLIAEGLVTPDDVSGALEAQLMEELYDLFLLEDADFEFRVNEDLPAASAPLSRTVGLKIDPVSVIVPSPVWACAAGIMSGDSRAIMPIRSANNTGVLIVLSSFDWTCSHESGHIWKEIVPHLPRYGMRSFLSIQRHL